MFLANGIERTGINEVTRRAGVARMSLYNCFASKEDLVLAVFEQEAELRREAIVATQEELDGPVEKVLALFHVAQELATLKGSRGCAFLNLALEAAAPGSAAHQLAKNHKDWILGNVSTHLARNGFREPDMLARQVLVLWDGAIVGAYIYQSEAPIEAARKAARSLLRTAAK